MATAAKKKATTKKPATKKTAGAKSTTTRKAAAKKTAAKKTAAPKAAADKSKTASKKTVKKAAPAKKTTPKTTTKKEAPAKSAAAKKPTKKAATKKAEAAKPVGKKTAKTTAKKASVKKPESAREAVPPKAKTKAKPTSTSANKETKAPVSTSVEEKKSESPKIAAARRPVRRQPFRKKGLENVTFSVNEQVVYPAHGVGKVIAKEKQSIADMEVELYVIDFEHEKMKLRVPTNRAYEQGMRPLSTNEEVDHAISLLQGRARIKRTMWSRRAQEYEAKINSGDLRSVAEVVRDLYRSSDQPEQSYSERQLYEQAVDRMAREVAAVRKVDQMGAVTEMEASLQKKKLAA